MRRFWWLVATSALGSIFAAPAIASETPLYQPVPAWVTPAPPIDAAKLGPDGPVYPVVDTQERLENGTVWSYHEIVTRLATPEVIQRAGTVSIAWQPAKGDLIVHKIEIIRGTQRIDALAGGKQFEVIRREKQLERFTIDGELTATMAVEGLQVGDLLRVVATISRKEDVIAPAMQDVAGLLTEPLPVGYARTRLVWPAAAEIKYKALAEGAKATVNVRGTEREVVFEGVLPKATELPSDAPVSARKLPLVEMSSFADWAAVSKVMAPHYATSTSIVPGSDLAKQVAAIKAVDTDPLRRASAALQLVQDKVRYLYNGLDKGNYVPQSAEQTWTMRYGDCKAKTLLLLAILRALDIEAEPMLAHIGLGELVAERLPSAAAFNHVLVHATIAGRDYWLDGTGNGTRLDDIADVPVSGWGLPVRADGAALLQLPLRVPQRPGSTAVIELDQRAGIGFPTVANLTVTLRGPSAAGFGLLKTQGSKEQRNESIQRVLDSAVGGDVVLGAYTIDYDPIAALATIHATGTATDLWSRENERWRLTLDKSVSNLRFDPDRARSAWQQIPAWTGRPARLEFTVKLQLPGNGADFALEGDTTISDALAKTMIDRRVDRASGVISVHDDVAASGGDIAPDAIPATRARVTLAKSRLLTVVAPEKIPPRWETAQQARTDGRFKPILAAYAAAIANDPTDVNGFENRARFLGDVYDYKAALPDLDQAVKLAANASRYRWRAEIEEILGLDAKALEDLKAAAALEPTSEGTIQALGGYLARHGQSDAAIALADQGIAQGGKARPQNMSTKAAFLARAGKRDEALKQLDAAIAEKPGSPTLLNERCWIKAQLAAQLDTALKDCTRSIELSDSTAAALDSRALVYFRLQRYDDALADLDAALNARPDQASSLYLRGIVLNRQGKPAEGKRDIAAAIFMSPLVAEEYRPYGIVP